MTDYTLLLEAILAALYVGDVFLVAILISGFFGRR